MAIPALSAPGPAPALAEALLLVTATDTAAWASLDDETIVETVESLQRLRAAVRAVEARVITEV
ncbi:MAG: hypothetical protein F2667_07850, partial [Actinobacteria bacterium]|nr:hypothetical protein [Actinomycetota bacterium]